MHFYDLVCVFLCAFVIAPLLPPHFFVSVFYPIHDFIFGMFGDQENIPVWWVTILCFFLFSIFLYLLIFTFLLLEWFVCCRVWPCLLLYRNVLMSVLLCTIIRRTSVGIPVYYSGIRSFIIISMNDFGCNRDWKFLNLYSGWLLEIFRILCFRGRPRNPRKNSKYRASRSAIDMGT